MRRAALIVVLAMAPAGTATADSAEHHAATAKSHFDAGEYAGAAMAYGKAYRVRPRPGLLYNLGQSYRLLGDCVAATTMYEHYLKRAPRSPYRALVEHHLATLETCTSKQALATTLARDDARPPARPGALASGGRTLRLAGLATTGAGVALLGAGLYFTIDADHAGDTVSVRDRPGGGQDDLTVAGTSRRSELAGAGLLGASAAAFVTGATLYLLGRRAERAGVTLSVTSTNPGGATAGVSWRF